MMYWEMEKAMGKVYSCGYQCPILMVPYGPKLPSIVLPLLPRRTLIPLLGLFVLFIMHGIEGVISAPKHSPYP